jgi:hypothetical protein
MVLFLFCAKIRVRKAILTNQNLVINDKINRFERFGKYCGGFEIK